MLACGFFGCLAGLIGLALSLARVSRWIVLAAVLLAVVSVLSVAFLVLSGHGFSVSATVFAVEREWEMAAVLLALPLILVIGAVVVLCLRGGPKK